MHCRTSHVLGVSEEETLAEQYTAAGRGTEASVKALIANWRRDHGNARGELLLYHAQGCKACDGHGYRGRMGLHELLSTDDTLRDLIRHRASSADMQKAALGAGMTTLRQDGIGKALAGLTDMAEVLAASNS